MVIEKSNSKVVLKAHGKKSYFQYTIILFSFGILYIVMNMNLLFHSPKTTISEIFAIMRQWVPQVQQNIEMLVQEVRGVVYDCMLFSCQWCNGFSSVTILLEFY